MSQKCLFNAQVGDIAKVCFTPVQAGPSFRLDRLNRRMFKPSPELTDYQFDFEIIDINHDWPVIGSPKNSPFCYGLSETWSDSRYNKYDSTYLLIPNDIKTVKIYKKKR